MNATNINETISRFRKRLRPVMLARVTMLLVIFLGLSFLLAINSNAWAAPVERSGGQDTLIAIIPADGPPSFYRDKKTGEAAGFAVDITNEIAKRAGFSVTYIFGDHWEEIRDRIQRGDADIVPGLSISPYREQYYSYTQPFDTFQLSVVARAQSGLREMNTGQVVGVLRGSVAYEQLRTRPGIQVIAYNNFQTGLFELLAGKIDAFAGPAPVLLRLAWEAGVDDHVEVIGKPIAEVKRAFGMKKGRTELAARLNNTLEGFIGSPEYNSIYVKWYGKPRSHVALSKQTLWIMIVLSLLIIALASWRHLSVVGLTRRLHQEIEDRNKAEETIKLNEERLRLALASSQQGWFDLDIPSGAVKVSPEYPKMIGYDPTEFASDLQTWISGIHPEDRGAVLKKFNECLQTGQACSMEYRRKTKAGDWKWLRSIGQVISRDSEGKPLRMIGTHADISEHRKAEEALRESEARLKRAQHAANLGSWEWNLNTNELYWAEENYRIQGLDPEKVKPSYQAFLDAIDPFEHEYINKQVADALSGKTAFEIDYTAIRPDNGERRIIHSIGEVLKDADGKAVKFVGTVQDVTERRKAETALRESEERMYLAMKATNLGLYDLNLKTGEAVVNAGYALMLGYDPTEFHETNAAWIERLHPDDRQPVAEIYQSYIKGMNPEYVVEFRQKTKDGVWKWIRSQGKIVEWDAEGNPIRMLGTHTDISKSKATAEALRESEALYRELFEAESDAIVLVDNETGRIIEANSAAAALYGYNRAELLSKKNTDLSAEPEDTQRITLRTTATPGEIVKIPQRLHHDKHGQVFPVEITGRFFTLFGRSVHIAAIRDITERRKAEDALRRSEALYHDLAETSQDMIWQCDIEGRYTYLNPAWEAVLGYKVEEMLGKKFTDFQTPEDAEKDLKEFARLMGGGMVKGYESIHIRKNGTVAYLIFNAKNVTNEQGSIIGTRGTAYDITDRKRVEREREQYVRFFQTSTDIMVIADPNGAFLRTNPACTDLLGYSANELLAKPFVDFIHPDDKQPTLDEMARQQKLGYSLNFENRYLCKDSSYKWLSWRANFVEEEGITYATARDISDRKQAEEQLQRSLEEKTVMLKEIHHRVKNNMQVITSLLNLQAREISDEGVRAMFAEARNRVHSMAMIHEKLYGSMDLAHIEFKEYLTNLVDGIADTYMRRDVVFSVDMEPLALDVNVGIPCGLIANELVSNSLKYAFPDGRKGAIAVGIRKDGSGNNVLTVADNGVGFPEHIDFSNTASLGLRLVNVLTGQIHGTVELLKEAGTTFRITFPGSSGN